MSPAGSPITSKNSSCLTAVAYLLMGVRWPLALCFSSQSLNTFAMTLLTVFFISGEILVLFRTMWVSKSIWNFLYCTSVLYQSSCWLDITEIFIGSIQSTCLWGNRNRLSHCFWPAGLLPCFFENAQLSYVVQNATVLPVLNQDSGYYTVYINHTYSSWFDATCYLHFSFLEYMIRDKQWPDGFLKTGLIWSIYWLVRGIPHENKGLKPQKELQHYFFLPKLVKRSFSTDRKQNNY